MASTSTVILADKYRPRRLSQVLGQDKAIAKVRTLARSGLGGRAYWISGKSGQGKSTLAHCLARAVQADNWCTTEQDAGELNESDVIAIRNCWYTYGWGGGGRAWIFNESHGLKTRVVRAFLSLLESGQIPAHVVIVFTTTNVGAKLFDDSQMDAGPLKSRCEQIALTSQGLAPVFGRFLHHVAQREGVNGQPLARYVALVNECGGNLREALGVVAGGEMAGGA